MSNFLRLLFVISLASNALISTCFANEVEFECNRTEFVSYQLDLPLTTCFVTDIKTGIDEDTVIHVAENDYTGFEMKNTLSPVFPTSVVTLFPHAIYLGFSNNNMTRIPDNTFRGASNLLQLWITGNELTEITEFTFTGANNLKVLTLGGNKIEVVSPKAFVALPKLESVEFDSNRLTSLDPRLFVNNVDFRHLSLSANNFNEVEFELSTKHLNHLWVDLNPKLTKLTLRYVLLIIKISCLSIKNV